MKFTLRAQLSACVVALCLGACVSPPGAADASLLQRMDAVLRQATPSFNVAVKLSTDQVRTGDTIALEVTSNTAGYLYLFQIDTDGRALSQVFPNAMDGANYIAAGLPVGLPRPNWRMAARGPTGVGYLMAVVTAKPLDLMALQSSTNQGRVEPAQPYGAAMAALRETAQ